MSFWNARRAFHIITSGGKYINQSEFQSLPLQEAFKLAEKIVHLLLNINNPTNTLTVADEFALVKALYVIHKEVFAARIVEEERMNMFLHLFENYNWYRGCSKPVQAMALKLKRLLKVSSPSYINSYERVSDLQGAKDFMTIGS